MEKNSKLMERCIDEAKNILNEKRLDYTHGDIVRIAVALFGKEDG
jgi:hypothetical protein